MLGMLFGQIPSSVTVCLCTGEVASSESDGAVACARHATPACEHCKHIIKKACFITKTTSHQLPAVATPYIAPGFAAILTEPFEVTAASWEPFISPQACLALPRIREPDRAGHHLRAPPSLA